MYALGADELVPQIGSVFILLLFYLSDFQVLSYVPKPAISSMLVLSSLETVYVWFYKSFLKTKNKVEWIVVPVSYGKENDHRDVSRNLEYQNLTAFLLQCLHYYFHRLLWFPHLLTTCYLQSFLALRCRHSSLCMPSSGVAWLNLLLMDRKSIQRLIDLS